MKILIVTLSYLDGGVYSKFYQTQNETWNSIEVDGVQTFFLVGNNLTDEVNGHLLKTNIRESLFNCGHKTLKAFELLQNFDFDFIFRTNSSSYIDKQILKDHLLDKPKNNFYSGVVGNHHGILFSSGSGFIITKDLVNLVLMKKNEWDHRYIDDVALGLLLKKYNINPTNAPRYDVEFVDDNIPLDYYHYRIKSNNRNVDCERMKAIHDLKKKYKINQNL